MPTLLSSSTIHVINPQLQSYFFLGLLLSALQHHRSELDSPPQKIDSVLGVLRIFTPALKIR